MAARQLHSVLYLRAAVAVMVVLHHLPIQLARLGYEGSWPELFKSRVDIFFVVSGFLMWIATVDRQQTPSQFLYRRFARIVPLYWLLTGLIIAAMLIAPTTVRSGTFDLWHAVKSFAFLPAAHPVTGYTAPVLIPGWTLNYEMFFYVVLAACLPWAPRLRLALVAAILAALVLSRPWLKDFGVAGQFYSSSILLEFALGLAVGAVYTAGQTLTPTRAVVSIALGITGLIFGPEVATSGAPRVLSYGVPSTLLLAGAVFFERARRIATPSRPVRALGDATYALFVSHGLVLSALCQVWVFLEAARGPLGLMLFTVAAVSLTLAAGLMLHRYVETPLHDLLMAKHRVHRRKDQIGHAMAT